MQFTESLFLAYCEMPFKAFLKSKGEVGQAVDYEVIQKEADAQFKQQAIDRLLKHPWKAKFQENLLRCDLPSSRGPV